MVGDSNAVSGKGPTAVFNRSGKRDKNNALSHCLDLTKILQDTRFGSFTYNSRGREKVLLLRSDNGPDEAPRNPSTQAEMIQLFTTLELVTLILVSLPAGYSPFSPCERRMAPLSKQLTTVVLDHKHYGNHLDSSKKTVDDSLERKNFKHEGDRLAGFFEEMLLDGH